MRTIKSKQRRLAVLFLILLPFSGCTENPLDRGGTVIPSPDESDERQSLTINSVVTESSGTESSGEFLMSGFATARGTYEETVSISGPLSESSSIYGLKVFTSDGGTLNVEYYAGLALMESGKVLAHGGFSTTSGTGSFEGLDVQGKILLEVEADLPQSQLASQLDGIVKSGPDGIGPVTQ